ncbi:MAG: DUF4870 family protein [Geminicoccaceae bacterium]
MTVIISYLLMIGGIVAFIPAVVAIILAYNKRGDAAGSLYASHIDIQINTLIIWFVAGVIGFITTFILIGWVILFGANLFLLYRSVRGLLAILADRAYGA